MPTKRLSVRIGPELERRLRRCAKSTGKDRSAIVREALDDYLSKTLPGVTVYDLMKEAGLIGCVKDAPPDLSTNRQHFEGLGKSR